MHTKSTCPKNEDWFLRGGRCGWAYECNDCEDNPQKEREREKYKADVW